MMLEDYKNSTPDERLKWLDSMKITVGLKYFGGKSQIGKYINNHICDMAVCMESNGKRADIFIDAFTGGGKIGLSIPYGWYDEIVINDLNYGVYSFYKCCKDDYGALIKMIDNLAEVICKDTFHLFAYLRNFGEYSDECKKLGISEKSGMLKEYIVDDLAAAAMTYWITTAGYNGISDAMKTKYALGYKEDKNDKVIKELMNQGKIEDLPIDKNVEERAIQRAVKNAHKRIPELHRILHRKNISIENLDYRELIKKYNGLAYKTLDSQERIEEQYKSKNKLWYFDPPYHPYTLAGGKDAPYSDTFTVAMSEEMVDILAGKENKTYGNLEYFIKSDFDTKEALNRAKESKKKGFIGENGSWYKKMLAIENGDDIKDENGKVIEEGRKNRISKVFEPLEKDPFKKICVGGFDKGAVKRGLNGEYERAIGYEYIWCRGFPT